MDIHKGDVRSCDISWGLLCARSCVSQIISLNPHTDSWVGTALSSYPADKEKDHIPSAPTTSRVEGLDLTLGHAWNP